MSLRSRQTGHPFAEEDIAPLDFVDSRIADLAWSQLSCSASFITDARRRLVIESLGLTDAGKSWLGGVPHDSPRLFGGKFGETCISELEGRKQASSLAALFPTQGFQSGLVAVTQDQEETC